MSESIVILYNITVQHAYCVTGQQICRECCSANTIEL